MVFADPSSEPQGQEASVYGGFWGTTEDVPSQKHL